MFNRRRTHKLCCVSLSLRMIPELEKQLNVKFPKPDTYHTEEFRQFLDDLCTKNNVDCSSPRTSARLLDKVRGDRFVWHLLSLFIIPAGRRLH